MFIKLLLVSFVASVAASNFAYAAAPVIEHVIDQRAVQGNTYQYTPVLSTGGVVNWSKAYGPDDVTINPSTGSISWTIPSDLPGESFHIGVTAKNAEGSATEVWIVTVGNGRRLYFDSVQGALKDAIASMASGDTLIIRNGLIDGSNKDNIIPGGSRFNQQPPSGTVGAFTTIMAEDPGGVTFDMKGVEKHGIHLLGSYTAFPGTAKEKVSKLTVPREYIAFKGMVFTQATFVGVLVEHVEHVKLVDLGIFNTGSVSTEIGAARNNPNLSAAYSNGVIVEGLYSFGHSRYRMSFYYTENSIVRRSVGRIDEYRGTQPIGGFQSYCSRNINGQNNVLVDSNQVDFWVAFKNFAAAFAAAATNCTALPEGIEYHRSIALNSATNLLDNDASDNPSIPTVLGQDLVGWDFKLDKFNHGTGAQLDFIHAVGNTTNNQGTFGNIGTTDYRDAGFFYSRGDTSLVKNSIMYNFGYNGSGTENQGALMYSASGDDFTLANNTIFGFSGALTGGGGGEIFAASNTTNVDPTTSGLKYLPKLEDDSLLRSNGEGGARTGAEVMTFLGNSGAFYSETEGRQETDIAMWPFPHEEQIREAMRNYSYTGTVRDGSTKTLSGIRGYTEAGQTLTNYIWTYLGNLPPAFNVTTIAGKQSVELRWDPIAAISKPDISGYKIYDVTGGSRVLVGSTDANTHSKVITGLTNGATYSYEVVTYNATKESTYAYRVSESPVAQSVIVPPAISIQ